MTQPQTRCLILACGNTLRGDDGVGLWLAEWAEQRFSDQAGVRILADHQWTPELAEDLAHAQSVLFIDCSFASPPGAINFTPVEPADEGHGRGTHHLDASHLLALARDLYGCVPRSAQQLTVGAGSTGLGERFSTAVTAALPEACRLIEEIVLKELGNNPRLPGV
jgi:hydrogenase maturation protease